MKKFYHLLLSGLLLCLATGISAQPLSVSVSDASGAQGTQVCVDVVGRNFNDISAFTFSLIFDPAVLSYDDAATTGSTLLGNTVDFNINSNNPNAIRTLWSLFFASEGIIDDGPFIIGSVCFTVLQEQETAVTIENMPVPIVFSTPSSGDIDDFMVSGGIINGSSGANCSDGVMNGNETGIDCGGPDCDACPPDPTCGDGMMNGDETGIDCGGPDCDACPPDPTCGDGMMNGNETGIDCGGPDCAPCGGNEGGPNLDCGMGTDNLVFCLGDACNASAGENFCVDLTVGNLTDITAFQMDIAFETGQLLYQSITTSAELSNNITVNPSGSFIRLLFFQPDQSGNTIDDGTIIATICFTNQTAAVTNLTIANLTARDTDNQVVPSEGNAGSVNNCGNTTPTCSDGILNGNETGIDCGGPDCGACPPPSTCDDGILNGNETGVDCGGPDCEACNTTGGPDTDCGTGTTDFVLCFGDVCDIPLNGTACLDVTAGNLTNITAFQADIITNASELTFLSFTDAGVLSHPINANTSTGTPRLLFFQPDQSGNTISDGTIIGTVCFTNLNTDASTADFTNITSRDTDGNAVTSSANSGTVNNCGMTMPTCTDGMMNGNETGVDCGGPDCAPCNTTGGPDLDCGMGTTDVTLCFGDACNVPVNGTACLDITVGNLTNVTAFQADIITNASELVFLSFTDAGALSHPIIANTAMGNPPRLLFFQPDQTGNTVPNGTIVGTVCFTNLNAGVSTADFDNLTSRDNNGTALPTSGNGGTVNDCAVTPTCDDGMMNGNETGIDCGGPDCEACSPDPTCDDGMMNGNETGVDCGGPDCDACPTCNDGIQNGDETGVDCGGSCAPCVTICGEGTTDAQVCVGNECAAAGAEVCLPIFIGNFNDLGGFQFELAYAGANLEYTRFEQNPALGPVLNVAEPNDGRVTITWNDVSLSGFTLPNDEPILEVCFTVENEAETPVTFLNPATTLRVFNELGQSLPVTSNPGSINGAGCGSSGPTCDDGMMNGNETGIDCGGPDCDACVPDPTCDDGIMNGNETGVDCGGPDCDACPPDPTCDDGMMNGNETGVDCGGPDCDACDTGGGPDLDCGMNTTDISICLGDVCNIPVNGLACVSITAGNFTDITAFQVDLLTSVSELTFVSWTDAGVLSHPIIASTVPGVPRLLFFQPDQSGNTIPDGTILGEVCFTNLNAGSSIITPGGFTARDNNGAALPTDGSAGTVNNCSAGPTCDDGMMNGNETGVDCGGPDCDACPPAPLMLDVQDGTANVGETVCVDVTVGDFNDITDIALTLNFDLAVLQLSSVTANTSLPGFGSGNFDTSTSGQITVTYSAATPRTLADDVALFTVCWTVVTEDETDVTITGAAATDGAGADLQVITSDGTINAGGASGDNVVFRVGSATGGLNQVVCLEVTTDNFTNIAGLQFAITYDATHLEFSSATSTGAVTGLQASSTEPGIIRVLWGDAGAQGNTLDDGTNLIDLCFTVLIPCETDVQIEDIPTLPIRITDGDNQTVADVQTVPGTVNAGQTTNCDVMPPSNLILDISSASGSVGQEVCLDLTVENFSALTDLSFSITYDESILSFTEVNNFGLGSVSATNVSTPSSGIITFDWDAATNNGQSLADGSVLFSLCFTVDVLQPTNVSFANSPTIIQAMNGSGQNVGIIPSGGSVNPDVPMTDGMTVIIGDATGAIGETVCLPLDVFDPEALTGFQFTIVYDPTLVEYIPGDNQFAFSGFLGINSNTPGILRVLWDEPTATANLADNGSELFQICFRILDDDPAIVCFADSPTAIEFSLGLNEVDVDLICGQINGGEAPMIANADVSNPSCFEESDGSINLSVTGGSNLTYTWSPDLGVGPELSNLPAGTYNVTITNPETGQTTTDSYTLSTLPFQVTVANTDGVSCFGAADGSITISTVGGAPPFLVDWSGSLQDGFLTQNDLDGGTYSVTVTDNNGCAMTQTNINVGEPPALNISGSPFNISDDDDGGVNTVVVGGRPQYTYSWSGPDGYTSTDKDIDDVTEPGTYCVTVTDNNSCTDIQCFAINAGLGAGVIVDPGCAEENNGSIDLTPTGGNGTYSYAWSNSDGPLPSPNTNRQDIDNLAPGDYTVVITSASQEITLTIGVDAPDPVVVTGMVAPATSGNNGSITIAPTGGNAPYTFAWADGPTNQNRTDLTPGEYCVIVTDNSDCSTEQCFTVDAAPVSFMSTSTLPASCSDGGDGTIRLVIANGSRPFTVRVEPIGTEEVVDSNTIEVMVPAGTYTVFVTDAQGAQIMTEETVTAPDAISATATVTSDTENDGCSGMVSLDISGGTAEYDVSWNNMDDGATISQLCSGAYVTTITDANGCTFTTDTIRVSRIDEALESITQVSCEGGTDGSIDVSITGGVAPLTFSWTQTGGSTELADTEDITDITNGDYTLTIVDATGAMLVRNYTVGVTAGFAVTASVSSDFNGFGVSCADAADGRAVAVVSGQAEYTFEWFLDDTTVDTDSILDNASAGIYQVLVISSAGCEIERTVEITAPAAIELEPVITPISCGSTNDGAISVTPSGGVAPYTFEWSTGSEDSQLPSLGAGTYGLTVTDANNCIAETSFSLTAPQDLAITFETTDATEGCNGSITVLPLGGNAPYQFFWPQLPNQGNNPTAEGLCPGEYTIEVTDATNCQTVTMVATVLDRRFPCLSAREVITPNGDGLNEAFILFCSGEDAAINNNIEIYNRWGQLVFQTEDYNCSSDEGINCFEGRTNDGTPLPAGPYYYIFNFTNPIGEEMQQRGSLTIVRE